MKKVLLIGLGGTGCRVVARVKRLIEDVEQKRGRDENTVIRFIGFDTDVNQGDAANLDIVRISRDAMVDDLLRREHGWGDWFPDNQMLRSRSMVRGAGQVRVLSRLALSDTLRRPGAIQRLDAAIKALQRENGLESDGLKIMIVSSFAGGTGSGIFLQVPLFLRRYIENNYPGGQILIRGLFALPDIYMDGSFNAVQKESMYANAYASLKELSLINKICLSNDASLARYNLKIDDLFDSKAILNANIGHPRASRKPYDFIFFVDNVNDNNNVLSGSQDIYIEEMSKVTYMQIYGPMASTTDSREDNLILTQMSTDGEAMYGSAGSAKIIYPYEDILEYCAERTLSEVVSTQWNVFDKRYRTLKKDLKDRQRKDPSIMIPDFGKFFIDEVNRMLEENNNNFLFLKDSIRETKFEEVGEGDDVRSVDKTHLRDVDFMAEVETYISDTFRDDPNISQLTFAADYTSTNNRESKQQIEYNVADCENALQKLYKGVEERIYERFNGIADSIIPVSFGDETDDTGKPYHIRNLLEKQEGSARIAVHPLAARYLLYSVLKTLQSNQEQLKNSWENSKKKIEKYWSVDRNPKTKDLNETWAEVVPSFFVNRPGFKKKYKSESDKQRKLIINYGKDKFSWLVNDVLVNRIKAILGQYQRVFNALENVEAGLRSRYEQIEEKYDPQNDNVSEVYVCASDQMLKDTYKSLTFADEGGGLGDIFSKLLKSIYTDAMTEMNSADYDAEDDDESIANEWYDQSVTDMFINDILPYYRRELDKNCSDQLKMNVYQALKKQARFNAEAKAKAQHLSEPGDDQVNSARLDILTMAFRKASPYLRAIDYHEPNPGNPSDEGAADKFIAPYWGLSQKVLNLITSENRQIGATAYMTPNNSEGNPENIASVMYSDYELCCYRAMYSVRLEEIPKFRESENPELQGNFYKSYVSRVRKMQEGRYGRTDEGLTPHIDIRWHSRQYLPMISGAMDKVDNLKAARAMWLGIFYKCIDVFTNEKDGKPEVRTTYVRFDNKMQGRLLHYNGTVISDKTRFYEIFKAFQQNDLFTAEMLEVLDPVLQQEAIEKVDSQNFNIIPVTSGMIGLSADEIKKKKKAIRDESDPEMQAYYKKELFNTNALWILQQILHSNLASEEEKALVADALWEILNEIRKPEAGRQMADERFRNLLMLIFMNSPYTVPVHRIRDNANEYVLDKYFSGIAEEYDTVVKDKVAAMKKKVAAVKRAAAIKSEKAAGKKAAGKSAGEKGAKKAKKTDPAA